MLVGGLEPWNFMTFHILGMSWSQVTNSTRIWLMFLQKNARGAPCWVVIFSVYIYIYIYTICNIIYIYIILHDFGWNHSFWTSKPMCSTINPPCLMLNAPPFLEVSGPCSDPYLSTVKLLFFGGRWDETHLNGWEWGNGMIIDSYCG